MIRLWRSRPILTTAFFLACALTLFFAVRFVVQAVYWSSHQEEPVQPWMTVGYVARSWGLDPREIDGLAGLPTPDVKGHSQPLAEIAKDRGVPVETVIDAVESAVDKLLADQGKPGTAPDRDGATDGTP
jgi:hypothetical protein